MDSAENHAATSIPLFLILMLGLLYSCAWIPSSRTFFPSSPHHKSLSNVTSMIPKDELETALEGASMKNKTLIITFVNKAYAQEGSMLDLFLQSFRLGEDTQFLLNHLLLIAVDQTSFDRCNLLHLHCYKLVADGVDFSGEKIYMSNEFTKMMWRRTLFLADVLRRGYSFIFTDTDVMWLRNPFARLSDQGEDLQTSCDLFNGNPWNESNPINTGFYFVASNNKTISLYQMWYSSRNESLAEKEQDVLGRMIQEGIFRRLGLRVRFLDTHYFGGFCQSGRNFSQMITIHANCCRTIKAKMIDLMALLNGWKRFKQSSNTTSAIKWPFHRACFNSWKIENNQTFV